MKTLVACAFLLFASACGSDDASDARNDAGLPDATPDAAVEADADTGAADGAVDAGSDTSEPDGPTEAAVDAGWGCTQVAHVGDSLTAYTIDPLKQAYAKVGISAQVDAYGGRAILQKLPADPKTGKQAALDFVTAGFTGCWVVALGTNDTANIAAGAWYTRAEAIDQMMTAIDPKGKKPVLWVNAYTTKTTGYWSNANMVLWNAALTDALTRWPNLKIYDWASVAATGSAPFSDGIHHTTAGYAMRNQSIAQALAAE